MPKRKRVPEDQRHADISDEALEKKRKELKNKNTEKLDKKCETMLMNYLTHKGLNANYWEMDEEELCKVLSKFWFEVRTVETPAVWDQ